MAIMLRNMSKTLWTFSNLTKNLQARALLNSSKRILNGSLYCNDASSLFDDEISTVVLKPQNPSGKKLIKEEHGKKSEPDFLMNFLMKNRRKDELSEIINSIRLYRRVMNSWHILEVIEQLSDYTKNRKGAINLIQADKDIRYFQENIEHCVQYLDNQQLLVLTMHCYKLGFGKKTNSMMNTFLKEIKNNIKDFTLEELFFLHFILRKNVTRYRKEEIYFELGNALSNQINSTDISKFSREKLCAILTILGECNVDGTGRVLKTLFDEEDGMRLPLAESLSILTSYESLEKSEKLMADVMIKENLSKITMGETTLSDKEIFLIFKKFGSAYVDGLSVCFNEDFIEYALERIFDINLPISELCEIYRTLRLLDYFSPEIYYHILRKVNADLKGFHRTSVAYNLQVITSSSVVLSDDEELKYILLNIISTTVKHLRDDKNSNPGSKILGERIDILFNEEDRDVPDAGSNKVFKMCQKLVMAALNLAHINLRCNELIDYIEDMYRGLEDIDPAKKYDFIFLSKLYIIEKILWNNTMDIPLKFIDIGTANLHYFLNKSEEIGKALALKFTDKSMFKLNVVSNGQLIPALIVLNENNEIVPITEVHFNSEDVLMPIENLDINPEHTRVAVFDLPKPGYNFDKQTLSLLDKKILEHYDFTVINVPKLKDLNNIEKLEALTKEFEEYGIKS